MRLRLPALALLLTVSIGGHARAQAEEPRDDRREQARAFFESGLAHFDRGESSAALADFLRSRELFPTRSATKNAAVCLRKEGRFDEALDMLEDLLRSFPDLPPEDRAFAESEILALRGAVGALDLAGAEPGAAIVVDGRARGTYPPTAPLRVPAGTHFVRVYKEGFVPFERKVDVAGRQVLAVDARLTALVLGGRLAVTETSGRALDLVVDNVVVGKTPWEGTLATGRHTLALRGDGDEGTPPVEAAIVANDVTQVRLSAETLDASLRVAPVPAGAFVSIDGVTVGQGAWEGKLRAGEHRIEVASDGFLPQTRPAQLAKGERAAISVVLERDPSSSVFRAAHPARVFVELEAAPAIGLTLGGEVRGSCADGCSAAIPFGLGATLRGGYELSSRVALGLDVGFLVLSARATGRATSVVPKGLPSDPATVDDLLALRGFRIGPSAGYRIGDTLPVTLRLGAGLFFGTGSDGRTGSVTTGGGAIAPVSVSESSRAAYAYVAPEARIGVRVWSRLEVSAGLTLLLLAALDSPTWTDQHAVLAAPAGQQGDGLATFGKQSMAGSFVLVALPGIGVHYAF